jgi:hypothetical protein
MPSGGERGASWLCIVFVRVVMLFVRVEWWLRFRECREERRRCQVERPAEDSGHVVEYICPSIMAVSPLPRASAAAPCSPTVSFFPESHISLRVL